MKNLLINVASFFAGIILYFVSFVKKVPNVSEPSLERVTLAKDTIERMDAIDVPSSQVIGQ
jgi:hypothetical protein